MSIQEVHNYLKSHKVKPSMQRTAIMQYLLEHVNHPDADRIYIDLVPSIPTLSKTTVYNTLKLFYDKKAVSMLFIDDKNVRYDGHTHSHAHFRCKKCVTIYDVPLEESDMPKCVNSTEFKTEETHVYFFGICKKCG